MGKVSKDSTGEPIEGLGFDLFSLGPPRTAGVYARYNY